MNRRDRIYGSTLNLLGSDLEPADIQACLDRERLAAERSHRVRRLVRWLQHLAGAR